MNAFGAEPNACPLLVAGNLAFSYFYKSEKRNNRLWLLLPTSTSYPGIGIIGKTGGVIQIYGGSINARGGKQAAGIGGGEDGNGGTITINGGYVYAEGKGWGAGIGAGEDGKGATVIITGGTVEAVAGSDTAAKSGGAIGSEDEDKGDIIFANQMCVIAGNTKNTAVRFSSSERKLACWYRSYARVEVCTHPGYDKIGCPYCED